MAAPPPTVRRTGALAAPRPGRVDGPRVSALAAARVARFAALALLAGCARPSEPPAPAAGASAGPAVKVSETAPRTVGDLGDHAFLTPIDAPATVALVAGGRVPSTAATCGGCHPEHHAEWSAATHAASTADLQYLAELAKPGQPRWLCLNCHAPTAPQRTVRITPDTPLRDGLSSVDAAAVAPSDAEEATRRAREGVTCATCHVRRDADGEGVVIGPRGSGRAPHRVRTDRAALTGICVQCHAPGDVSLGPTLPCWFDTADEVAAGPEAGTSCVDCHMPSAERPAAAGGPPVTLRRHLWVGGGVPKSVEGYDTLLERGWEPGLDVTVSLAPPTVTLTNARSGHALPTADPERHLRVEARLEDAAGAVLAADVLRIGQTWDWGDAATGRPASRLADDRLVPGEARRWTPTLAPAPGAVRLRVEVAHVRLTPENAAGMSRAVLDGELLALRPDAAALLPALTRHYPLATVVFDGAYPLDGGAPALASPEARVAASRALAALPLEALRERLGIPARAAP